MASEDKTFDLIEKMYAEVQNGFEKVNSRIDNLDSRMDSLDSRIDKVEQNQVAFENKFDTKITALFDGYNQLGEKFDRIENTVNDIAQKVNNQEVEIRVLKAVK